MLFRHRTMRIPPGGGDQIRKSGRPFQRIELDLANDRHARAALEAYADSSASDMPWLAETLSESLGSARPDLTRCTATVRRVFDLAQEWAATQPDYASLAWEHVRTHLDAALGRQRLPSSEAGHGDDLEIILLSETERAKGLK